MQPDEVTRQIVNGWLAKATEDLDVARHLLATQSRFFATIAFHSQQAAEKALKAYLVRHQKEFPKTHDIGRLLDLASGTDAPLAQALHGSTGLVPYAVEARYPGEYPILTEAEARQAVSIASDVLRAVCDSLRPWLDEGSSAAKP